MMGKIAELIAENWQPFLSFLITWVLPFIVVFGAIYLGYRLRKPAVKHKESRLEDRSLESKTSNLEVISSYEDNNRECGLIIHNTGKNHLKNCHARLLDLAFEKPLSRLSLKRYSRLEDLVFTPDIPEFGDGKIPLFRWGVVSKDLEIVYQSKIDKIGFRIANVPILALLHIWADNIPATYAVCKLSDRLGWGYDLSIVETGILQGEVKLANYQKSSLDIEGTDSQ